VRDFLLDTQTISYWYAASRPEHQAVMANVESLRRQVESMEYEPRLLVSVITLGEIEFGYRANPSLSSSFKAEYLRFVTQQLPVVLDVTKDTVAAYGELRNRLFEKVPKEKRRRKMRPEQLIDPITSKELGIQENDLWLSAQAVAHDMVLVTNDKMLRIREVSQGMQPALRIQNWANPNAAKVE
jgi:tRNA(fMet)-specific endonuclease VapC